MSGLVCHPARRQARVSDPAGFAGTNIPGTNKPRRSGGHRFAVPCHCFNCRPRQAEVEAAYGKSNHTAVRAGGFRRHGAQGAWSRTRARSRYVRRSARTLYAAAKHGPGGPGLVPRRGFQGVVGDIVAENLGFRLVETDIVHCVNLSRASGKSGQKQKKRRRGLRRLMSETYRSGSH